MAVGVYDVQQADNVGVVHLLEQGDLANGGRGDALIFGFEADLLEGDDALVLGGEVARLVDNSISSWLQLLVRSNMRAQTRTLSLVCAYPLRPSPASGNSPWRRCTVCNSSRWQAVKLL